MQTIMPFESAQFSQRCFFDAWESLCVNHVCVHAPVCVCVAGVLTPVKCACADLTVGTHTSVPIRLCVSACMRTLFPSAPSHQSH